MRDYLIRTEREGKKTHIVRLGSPNENVGMIYTDFNFYQGVRDLSIEDVVNSKNKRIARVSLFGDRDLISVGNKQGELSAFSRDQEYTENGVVIPYRKLTRTQLLERPEYEALEDLGVTHAYFLAEKSDLSQVLCYEKDGEISGVVSAKKDSDLVALKGLSLVLAQKIEDQDYIFEFVRK
jgi:hypothetical protein